MPARGPDDGQLSFDFLGATRKVTAINKYGAMARKHWQQTDAT